MLKVEILGSHSMFASLPSAEIDLLAETLLERISEPGEILLSEGGRSDSCYLVLDGEVEILKALASSDERQVALRGRGALLGEMSMFNAEQVHSASVRARTQLHLLEITRDQFNALLCRRPELAVDLLGVVSRRLEESENTTIRELREKNLQLTDAYRRLQEAQAQLIEKEKLERELEIANRLQQSILPQVAPRHDGYDFGALMVPAHAVGGDFYDFIPLDGNRLGIVVGDVCDKGIPAALFMTLTYTALRGEVRRHADPGAVLREVNRRLLEINAAEMYVTLLYGVLDLQTGQFCYARAGHPHPILFGPEHQSTILAARSGQPLGLFDDIRLDEQCFMLSPGSTLMIYSDGLSESLQQRGMQDLTGMCAEILAEGVAAQALCARLWQTVDQTQAGIPTEDDFTVLVVRAAS